MPLTLDALVHAGGKPIAVLVALDDGSGAVRRSSTQQTDDFEQHRLLNVEQAAEFLAVGRDAVYSLIDCGRLRSIKIGGSRRVPRQALIDFVRSALNDSVTAAE